MIHVVDRSNAAAYADLLDQYFRVRHDIFVVERGWSTLARADGRERDQFDTEDATYVLAIEDGKIVAGSRLVPCDRPTLLGEVYPWMVQRGAPPSDAATIEWTRVFVVKDRREGRFGGRLTGEITCALVAHALDQGAEALCGVVDAWWLPFFVEQGFVVKPLGLPETLDGKEAIAIHLPITSRTLADLERHHGVAPGLPRHRQPEAPRPRLDTGRGA